MRKIKDHDQFFKELDFAFSKIGRTEQLRLYNIKSEAYWPLETCWFCEKRPSNEKATFTVQYHKTNLADPIRHNIRHSIAIPVTIPRCINCRTRHRGKIFRRIFITPIYALLIGGSCLIGFIPFMSFSDYLVTSATQTGGMNVVIVMILPLITTIIGSLLAFMFSKYLRNISDSKNNAIKTKPLADFKEYPVIKVLESIGMEHSPGNEMYMM